MQRKRCFSGKLDLIFVLCYNNSCVSDLSEIKAENNGRQKVTEETMPLPGWRKIIMTKNDIAKKIILPLALIMTGTGYVATMPAISGETEHQNQVIEVMAAPAAYGSERLSDPDEKTVQTELIGEKIAIRPEYDFIKTEQKAWLVKDSGLKESPYADSLDSAKLVKYDEIKLTGTNGLTYWEAWHDGKVCYIDQSALTTEKSVIAEMKEKERKAEIARKKKLAEKKAKEKAEKEAREERRQAEKWNGKRLTPSGGVCQGPSGKETYYNLPMGGVVKIMRSMGNKDKYWIRKDGCKMLGKYIIVAANLKTRPRGTIVKTSLGMAIVCDTGTFAESNPRQLDIAVNW